MADIDKGGGGGPTEMPTVTIVHKIKCKLGYAELHKPAPGFGDGDKELVDTVTDQKNWKGVSIAILVIILILATVGLSIFVFTPPKQGPKVTGSRITIDHILNSSYFPRLFNGTWISDTELVYMDPNGGLSMLTLPDSSVSSFLPSRILRQYNVERFTVSPDRQYVLISFTEQQLGGSASVLYATIQVGDGTVYRLEEEEELSEISYVTWDRKGSALLIASDGSLYYSMEPGGNLTRIEAENTEGKNQHNLIYGVPHLLYQEHFWKSGLGTWFSESGSWLLASVFDLTDDCAGTVYTGCEKLTKAGERLPAVSLVVVDVSAGQPGQPRHLQIQSQRLSEFYISSVGWISDSLVSVTLLSRSINRTEILVCGPPDWICVQVYTDLVQNGRPDFESPVFQLSDSTAEQHLNFSATILDRISFVFISPVRDGNSGYFRHIVLVDSGTKSALTLGRFTVDRILGWDRDKQIIYFLGTPQNQPGERDLYKVSSVKKESLNIPVCLSCQTNQTKNCTFVDAHFSTRLSYYGLTCLGPDYPYSLLINPESADPVMQLDMNAESEQLFRGLATPLLHTASISTVGGELGVRLHLPPDLDDMEVIKYPLLIHLCEDVDCPALTSEWKLDFSSSLASFLKVIVAEVDIRGSSGRGESWRSKLYQSVGKIDIEDLLTISRSLVQEYKFIDETRIAVLGARYGGFRALSLLSQRQSDVFKCGIAVSPIIDWKYSDCVVGEEYLGNPNQTINFSAYEDTNLLPATQFVSSNSLILIHGTLDRLVPLDSSMRYSKELTTNGVLFKQQIYADEGNSLKNVQRHYLTSVQDFLLDCLDM